MNELPLEIASTSSALDEASGEPEGALSPSPPAPLPNSGDGLPNGPPETALTGTAAGPLAGLTPPREANHSRSAYLAQDMLALIREMALDPRADVEKFERLLAMKERMEAREAEIAFNESKARIKKRLIGIRFTKTKAGPDNAYRYMPLDKIDELLAPLLADEAMDLSWTEEMLPNGWLSIRGRLKHLPRGHYEDSTMPAPQDATNKMKSPIQAVGSTNSYLRRYVTANIFNIVVIGDDDDGAGGPISDSQAKVILDLIPKAGAGPRFLKYMNALSVDEAGSLEAAVASIAHKDYAKAISALTDLVNKKKEQPSADRS